MKGFDSSKIKNFIATKDSIDNIYKWAIEVRKYLQ